MLHVHLHAHMQLRTVDLCQLGSTKLVLLKTCPPPISALWTMVDQLESQRSLKWMPSSVVMVRETTIVHLWLVYTTITMNNIRITTILRVWLFKEDKWVWCHQHDGCCMYTQHDSDCGILLFYSRQVTDAFSTPFTTEMNKTNWTA